MTLATPDTENVSVQEYWLRGMWLDHIETYWREFSSPGFPAKRTYTAPGTNDHSTLFVRKTVAPGRFCEIPLCDHLEPPLLHKLVGSDG